MAISINYPISAAIDSYTRQDQADAVSKSSLVTQQSPLNAITLNPLTALQRVAASTVTQLSSYGQIKSSLADLQDKALALKNISQPPTFSDFKVVVQAFVQSFNSINKTVSNLTSKKGSLNGDNRSSEALNDIRKAAGGKDGKTLSALKELGISQQADSTFSINHKEMKKSFQANPENALSTIFDLANRVTEASDKLLSDNGTIGKKTNDLNARIDKLQSAYDTVEGYMSTQPSPPQASTTSVAGGYTAFNAIATYASVASF